MTVRVGILGLGSIGRTHARVVASLSPQFSIVAYSGESSRDDAQGIPALRAARREGPDALLADPEVDLVVIASPSNEHGEQAIAAFRAGKAAVVEKPLATTASQTEQVIEAWRESGAFGSVIAQRRLEPQHLAIKRLLDDGALGTPLFGEVSVLWWRDEDYYRGAQWRTAPPGGSVLMNQALHSLDLLTWLLGEVTQVAALAGNLAHDMRPEDTAVAAVRFASGAMGSITASTATRPGSPARLAIHTDRGAFVLDHSSIAQWDFPAIEPPEGGAAPASGAGDPTAIGDAGHRIQWLDIARALETGTSPAITPADGLPVIRLIDAVHRSVATGRLQNLTNTSRPR